MRNKVEVEFEELVEFLSNIESKFELILRESPNSGLNKRAFDDVTFGSVVNALMQLLDSKCLNKHLHLSGIRILRKIVEVENKEH